VFGHCEVVQALIKAGACSNAAQAKQALGDVRNGFVLGLGSALSMERTLRLLLTADYPKYCKPTVLDVVECCTLCLSDQLSHPAAAQLLLYLTQAYGSAAAAGVLSALREAMTIDDPTALRVALLRGWAAVTAEGDAGRAATTAIEQRAAATRSGFRALLLGVALAEKDRAQQDNSPQQPVAV
jgi:hypothetical protein